MEWYLVCFLVGALGGYILCDKTTIEKRIDVAIKKQKVRGEGNRIDSEIHVKPEDVNKKQRERRLFKRKKK